MMISASQGFINQSDRYDKDNAGTSKSKYTLIKYGELSYNHGNSKIKKYGAVFAMNDKGALIPFVYHTFSIRKPNNPFYFAKYLNLNIHNRYLKKVISSGARMDGLLNISLDDFFKMPINYPNLEEQNKINDFLEKLDVKINLINDKISILKKYKKGVFLDTRKCSKKIALKTILSEVNIKTKYNNQYEILSSTAIGLFSQKEYFKHQVASGNNVGYKVIKKGQLLFSPQNLWLGNINLNNDFEIGMVSPSYKIYDIDNSINSSWLISMLKSQNMLYKYKQISEQGASVVRRNLDLSQFLEITLDIPNNQIQIGITLETIDKKINALSNLLMNLKNLKMHLLNEMFI